MKLERAWLIASGMLMLHAAASSATRQRAVIGSICSPSMERYDLVLTLCLRGQKPLGHDWEKKNTKVKERGDMKIDTKGTHFNAEQEKENGVKEGNRWVKILMQLVVPIEVFLFLCYAQ